MRGGAGSAASPSASGQVNLDGSTSPGNGGGATAPEPGASSALNLDLHGGGRGPSLSRSRSGIAPILPGPADEAKSKLGQDLDKAGRPNCKEAYQNNGILAVIPLAKDAVTGKGCKW